jgi:hypothetical protein
VNLNNWTGKSKLAYSHCVNPENGNLFWTAIDADPPVQYPQSLGELCLEVVDQGMSSNYQNFGAPIYVVEARGSHQKFYRTLFADESDTRALRRALYYKPENHGGKA